MKWIKENLFNLYVFNQILHYKQDVTQGQFLSEVKLV